MPRDRRAKKRAKANFLRWLELEHELADKQLDAFQVLLPRWRPDRPAVLALERLVAEITEHLRIEEEELFPWLEETLPGSKPKVDALLAEHGRILRAMKDARDAPLPVREAAMQALRQLLESHSAAERELAASALAREEDALDW